MSHGFYFPGQGAIYGAPEKSWGMGEVFGLCGSLGEVESEVEE